ncbi:hypothetical protein V5F40_22855 [Xanthobacter sp. DSM 14520]|uniref:hypothetical protein n=1 Tax=Xanthobacter autotrophicus (strain ATCC BAA-1158 / Py2) TaxID=78245 RepID=UPI00372AEA8A
MEIVSSQSGEQIAQARAIEVLEGRLDKCVANLLRIMAGAGHPGDVLDDMREVLEAWRALSDLGYLSIDGAISKALDIEAAEQMRWAGHAREDLVRWSRDGTRDHNDAIAAVRKACLRMAAADLLGQATQRTTSRSALHEGVRDLVAAQEKIRSAR